MAPEKYLFFFFLSYLCLEFACCASLSSNDCGTLEKDNKKVYAICVDLQTINGTFEYDYNDENSSLTVLFTATPPNPKGWILWGINPNHTGLQGAQVIAAFKQNNALLTRNFDLKSYLLPIPDKISIEVWGARADEEFGRMNLFASIKLPVNVEAVNLVWQKGSSLTEDNILVQDASSKDNLEVKDGFRLLKSLSDSVKKWRTVHGGISGFCWGFLHPLGVMVETHGQQILLSYPAWYNLHICCRSFASIGGDIGFIIGLVLGSKSADRYSGHLIVGIILFILDIVQNVIFFIKPNKDHPHRKYWDICHQGTLWLISLLGVFNVWIGFQIWSPTKNLLSAYRTWMGLLCIILLIEFFKLFSLGVKMWKRKYGKVDAPKESGQQLARLGQNR